MQNFGVRASTIYTMECWRNGVRLWTEVFPNLVVTVGLNKLLDATFKTGEAANQWFVGLVNNASFSAYAATDTMGSHAGWLEGTPYSDGTRQAFVGDVPSGGTMDNTASKAVFNINATQTVRGAFLTDSNTKGGTSGTLYGVGDFPVARSLVSGDVLTIAATLTMTAT